jgi:hypothetical protein
MILCITLRALRLCGKNGFFTAEAQRTPSYAEVKPS